MTERDAPKIKDSNGAKDFTKITCAPRSPRDRREIAAPPVHMSKRRLPSTCHRWVPDLAKFGMTELDEDIVALMERRACALEMIRRDNSPR